MSVVQRVRLPECSGQPSRAILCHCFDDDSQRLAVSYGSEVIYLYKRAAADLADWHYLAELVEHESRVTGLDWKGEQLVSCGADRNAYVWVEGQEWKPTLVLLRIKRAATCVRWAHRPGRFAVGSAARVVSICHYESNDDLWVSRQIRRAAKGTVTCVDWHPNDAVLAVGSVDCKVRLFSVPHGASSGKFGEPLYELDVNGWVHCLAYSSTGLLAFSTHLSSLGIIAHEGAIGDGGVDHFRVLAVRRLKCLPFRALLFRNEHSLLAGGFDNKLASIDVDSGQMEWVGSRDGVKAHNNSITELHSYRAAGAAGDLFSSGGLDGQILIWKI